MSDSPRMSSILRNCSFRYSVPHPITSFSLIIDGPFTLLAAVFALIGSHFAFKFLKRARINRSLTAALFSLCVVDSLLMLTVVFFYSIEANSVLLINFNFMSDKQAFTSRLHGFASSLTTASTALVVYITALRFLVFLRPMRFTNRKGNLIGRIIVLENVEKKTRSIRSIHNGAQNQLKSLIRALIQPGLIILFCFIINIPVFFEFTIDECYDTEKAILSSCPHPTRFRAAFARYRAILMTLTQTIGPVTAIFILTLLVEYNIHRSLSERRRLFESSKYVRSPLIGDELKEKVSRAVSIFIAIKFIILRSMPVFFDIYEYLYGIESFGFTLSILVRLSDFMIVLNSATNTLAYFGKKRWLEKKILLRLRRKNEKKKGKSESSQNSLRCGSVDIEDSSDCQYFIQKE